MFAVLAEDTEVIQEILRVILSDPGLVVDRVVPQRAVSNLLGRSVRLDAWCHLGDGRECNVEVQRADHDDHLRRVRYNSSGITWTQAGKGTDFKDIPNVCVIYISEFDFLGGGRTIYHVAKVVRETGDCVDDGLEEIFVNTSIDDGSVVADLMRCFLQSDVSNPKFPALSRKMNGIKNTTEGVDAMSSVVERYFGNDLRKAREEAFAEGEVKGRAEGEAKGRAEGSAKLASLFRAMQTDGAIADFAKAADDAAFCEAMYEKYGIR